jgi:hypothetical protein
MIIRHTSEGAVLPVYSKTVLVLSLLSTGWLEERQLRYRFPQHIADALSGFRKMVQNPELRAIRLCLLGRT